MTLKLDKIYIIHYVKLRERKAYLERRLKELNLVKFAEWVISEKDGSFPKSYYKLHDKSNQAIDERRKYLDEFPSVGKIDIIMMLQHIQILKKIAKGKKGSVSIVFEDDVLLDTQFKIRLINALDKLSKLEWDICYSDKGSLLVEPRVKIKKGDVTIYKPLDKRANTTGSYLITPEGAKKLLNLMKKIALGPDLELTYTQRKHKLNVFWTVPFLTSQGSIGMVYQSNVRKGSLFGILIVFLSKIEKLSPILSKSLARLFDKIAKSAYKSPLLLSVKNQVKKLIGYH